MVNLSAPNPLLSITFKGLRNIKMSSTPIQFETEEKKIGDAVRLVNFSVPFGFGELWRHVVDILDSNGRRARSYNIQ
jgi:hypothetical protein